MPHRCGAVTAIAAFVAMAASTALPPRAITVSPACVARPSALATMRCGARTVVYGTDGVVTAAPYRRPSAHLQVAGDDTCCRVLSRSIGDTYVAGHR